MNNKLYAIGGFLKTNYLLDFLFVMSGLRLYYSFLKNAVSEPGCNSWTKNCIVFYLSWFVFALHKL